MRARDLTCVVALLLAPACKKKSEPAAEASSATAKMSELRANMCACRDQRCAEQVQVEMTRWSQDMAKQAGGRRPEPMSEEQQRKYADDTTQMAECAQKAYGAEPEPPPADAAAAPPPPPPAPEKITNADRLIKMTFDTLGDHALKKLVISYVRADGTIDDEYGEAAFDLGKPRPPDPRDDPKRPVGAPIRKPATPTYDETARCPSYRWSEGKRVDGVTACAMAGPGLRKPTCNIVQVWKRAIEQRAPREGLAVIELRGGTAQSWSFAIEDEPRNIHVALEIPDDCTPVLEAPP